MSFIKRLFLPRAKIREDALAVYTIPFQDLRNDDGTVMDASGGAGLFKIVSVGFGTGGIYLEGEAASGNIKTDILIFDFILPPEYVSAGDVKLVVRARETVGAATDSTTLSAEVYRRIDNSVGTELLGAFDSSDLTFGAPGSKTATVTSAGLVAGYILEVLIKIVTNDTAGSVGTIAEIDDIQMRCDIKG